MSGTVVVNQVAQTPAGTGSPGTGGSSQPGSPHAVTQQGATCISKRKFRIRVREPRGARIRSATVLVNGKTVAVAKRNVDGKLRYTAEVDLRGLGKGSYKVEITAVTDKGERLRGTRTYQTCAGKLASTGLPKL
jgi:hypothetical protein